MFFVLLVRRGGEDDLRARATRAAENLLRDMGLALGVRDDFLAELGDGDIKAGARRSRALGRDFEQWPARERALLEAYTDRVLLVFPEGDRRSYRHLVATGDYLRD